MTALLLGYDDIDDARRFFVEALGFTEVWTAHDPDGTLVRSHVLYRNTVLMLDRHGAHGMLDPRVAGGVTTLILVNVGDVDVHHAQAVAAGAEILVPPTDRPWGRDYELVDPGGHVFSFIP